MNNTTSLNFIEKPFGSLPDGTEIKSYTLTNLKGTQLTVTNYGATITSLKVAGKNNDLVDVVLGFDDVQGYIDSYSLPSAPYFGAVMGRYAGRIKNGKFTLNGTGYQLNTNLGNHHLHGGNVGFGRAVWKMTEAGIAASPFIKLQYISPDGEEHYPGELTIEVTYTLTEDNQVIAEYAAVTDKDTVINLTQHSYFNLDGHTGNVKDQQLQVFTDTIVETDALNIPTGNFIAAADKGYHFLTPNPCPEVIDTSFVIKDNNQVAAVLTSEKSGLKMTVQTNQPSVHIYVGGNCGSKLKGKDGTVYHSLSGICFETQNFPDAPNMDNFPSAVLRKEEKYYQKTVFKFENNK
ncbi:aldose epimerase family protein [Flavobacterium sp. ST-75]|uniref:Aldose 1-epimerase n=1 Tax=Flavobacterium rhizophilum TaxID=3163296 RepID=A0ABW8YBN2_9FLAO